MVKSYNIVDKKILIESPFEYKNSDNFNEFESKDIDNCDIKIKFIEKDKPFIYRRPLYDDNYIKIYKDRDNRYIREFTGVYNGKSYGALYDRGENNYECFYYPISKDIINSTYKIFDMIALENILYKENTFLLHSSYIRFDDSAILFSGPCGIGKSTQATLWEKYNNAEIINGDRVAINKSNGEWSAYGIPYAGSSKICKNIITPIKSIVILRQAKQNSIKKLNPVEAFKYIYSETTVNTWNKDYVNTITNLISEIVCDIPVFLLSCLPNKEAVYLLEEELKGEGVWSQTL